MQVDWNNLSLSVLYSTDDSPLKAVTGVVSNPTAAAGPAGQGDYHFTVLKVGVPVLTCVFHSVEINQAT